MQYLSCYLPCKHTALCFQSQQCKVWMNNHNVDDLIDIWIRQQQMYLELFDAIYPEGEFRGESCFFSGCFIASQLIHFHYVPGKELFSWINNAHFWSILMKSFFYVFKYPRQYMLNDNFRESLTPCLAICEVLFNFFNYLNFRNTRQGAILVVSQHKFFDEIFLKHPLEVLLNVFSWSTQHMFKENISESFSPFLAVCILNPSKIRHNMLWKDTLERGRAL